MKALNKAIEYCGGLAALARAIGTNAQIVYMWRRRGSVPPKYAIAIERLSGGSITRHELCPKVFGMDGALDSAAQVKETAAGS
jgi:DNA-binding transcriptional regulator YdaS (Cro superfamily)